LGGEGVPYGISYARTATKELNIFISITISAPRSAGDVASCRIASRRDPKEEYLAIYSNIPK
jgi:hypothetical protein